MKRQVFLILATHFPFSSVKNHKSLSTVHIIFISVIFNTLITVKNLKIYWYTRKAVITKSNSIFSMFQGVVMRIIMLFVCAFLLSSCVSNVETIKKNQITSLSKGSGYLLLAVDTDMKLDGLYLAGEKNLKFTSSDLKKGTNYLLAEVPAGDYYIKRVDVNFMYYIKTSGLDFEFSVESGKINYVGHFSQKSGSVFRSSYLDIHNKSVDAINYLNRDFEDLLKRMPLVYKGPGKDQFLSRMQALQLQGKSK